MAWTEERVELLKRLWADGLSASQIAARLGGVTRNAVIGKVHRLGLSGRATTTRAKTPRPRRRTVTRIGQARRPHLPIRGNTALKPDFELDGEYEPAHLAVEELEIPPEERASITTLKPQMCRWPIGDPQERDFYFCGRSSAQGGPYCPHHARVAYQPMPTRRRDRRPAQG